MFLKRAVVRKMRINLFKNCNGRQGRKNRDRLKEIGEGIFKTYYNGSVPEVLNYCKGSNVVVCANFTPKDNESMDVDFNFYEPQNNDLKQLEIGKYQPRLPNRLTVLLKRGKSGLYENEYRIKTPDNGCYNLSISTQKSISPISLNPKILYEMTIKDIFSKVSRVNPDNKKYVENRQKCICFAEELMNKYGLKVPQIFDKIGDEGFILIEDGSYPCIDGFSSVTSPLTGNELAKKYNRSGIPAGMLFIYDDRLPLRSRYLEIYYGGSKFDLEMDAETDSSMSMREISAPSEDCLDTLRDELKRKLPDNSQENALKVVYEWKDILECSESLSDFLIGVSIANMQKLGLDYIVSIKESALYEPLFLPFIKTIEREKQKINALTNASLDFMVERNMKPFSKPIDINQSLLKEDGAPWRVPYTLARDNTLGVNIEISLIPYTESYFLASQAVEDSLSMNKPCVVTTSFGSKYLNEAFDYFNICDERKMKGEKYGKVLKRLNRQALPFIVSEIANKVFRDTLLSGKLSEDKTYIDKNWIESYARQLCRDNKIERSYLYQSLSDRGFVIV